MSDLESKYAVLSDLNSQMRCGIFTNAKGEVLIVHDEEIKGSIDYVHYDLSDLSFSLVFEDGRTQNLGIELDGKIRQNLLQGSEVTIAFLDGKTIKRAQHVLFLIREY